MVPPPPLAELGIFLWASVPRVLPVQPAVLALSGRGTSCSNHHQQLQLFSVSQVPVYP